MADYERARAFYDACLGALGYAVAMEIADSPDIVACGYGEGREPAFWIGAARRPGAAPVPPDGQHVAFVARDRAAVDAFHAAAVAAGGGDSGPPGLRPHYHPDYYAAFVIDPDGYRVEAVCHRPG